MSSKPLKWDESFLGYAQKTCEYCLIPVAVFVFGVFLFLWIYILGFGSLEVGSCFDPFMAVGSCFVRNRLYKIKA